MSISATDAMNEVLERCSDLGFEMAPGFSTHWAMGSETLAALGHPERSLEWAELFRTRYKHYERPTGTKPIDAGDEAEWRGALRDWDRVGDWYELFERELAGDPWRDVLARWWPRLVPGVSAGLTHGLIRTMHAVRGIARSEPAEPTALQRRELATGLAYWAGKFVQHPAAFELHGAGTIREAIPAIPRIDSELKLGLVEKGGFGEVRTLDGWAEAVESLAAPADVHEAFSDLTLSFAQVHLSHPKDFPIPMVHTMTAPVAARQMLEHLPQELHALTFVALWHSNAALLTMFAQPEAEETAAEAPGGEQPTLSREELRERAVEHGDMHVIKLTDALLREHERRPDPRYLPVPERLLTKLPPLFRGSRPSVAA